MCIPWSPKVMTLIWASASNLIRYSRWRKTLTSIQSVLLPISVPFFILCSQSCLEMQLFMDTTMPLYSFPLCHCKLNIIPISMGSDLWNVNFSNVKLGTEDSNIIQAYHFISKVTLPLNIIIKISKISFLNLLYYRRVLWIIYNYYMKGK